MRFIVFAFFSLTTAGNGSTQVPTRRPNHHAATDAVPFTGGLYGSTLAELRGENAGSSVASTGAPGFLHESAVAALRGEQGRATTAAPTRTTTAAPTRTTTATSVPFTGGLYGSTLAELRGENGGSNVASTGAPGFLHESAVAALRPSSRASDRTSTTTRRPSDRIQTPSGSHGSLFGFPSVAHHCVGRL